MMSVFISRVKNETETGAFTQDLMQSWQENKKWPRNLFKKEHPPGLKAL